MQVIGVVVAERVLGPESARVLASEKQPRGVHVGLGTLEDVVVVAEVEVDKRDVDEGPVKE